MPKCSYFSFRWTYGAVFNMNFLCPVEGLFKSRAPNPSLAGLANTGEVIKSPQCAGFHFSFIKTKLN